MNTTIVIEDLRNENDDEEDEKFLEQLKNHIREKQNLRQNSFAKDSSDNSYFMNEDQQTKSVCCNPMNSSALLESEKALSQNSGENVSVEKSKTPLGKPPLAHKDSMTSNDGAAT